MDTLTPLDRSARMAMIHDRDTKPEMAVRRLLYHMGYRYRLHTARLPGKPDIVFGKRKKAIFVHGCFWHRHPEPTCALARLPKSRLHFWRPKLEANAQRDIRNQLALAELRWQVLVVWECELRDSEQLENTLRRFLDGQNESD